MIFLIAISFTSANAQTYEESDSLFYWIEYKYSHLFYPFGQISQQSDEWYYRYYSASNTYLGLNKRTWDVYVYGDIFGGLMRVGRFADLNQIMSNSSEIYFNLH